MAKRSRANNRPDTKPRKRRAESRSARTPTASLARSKDGFRLRLGRASSLWRYDSLYDPGIAHTWLRGDVADVALPDLPGGRVLILDILQYDDGHASEQDTCIAAAWLYNEEDALEQGVVLSLAPGETHVLSSNVQVLDIATLKAPLDHMQREREVNETQIIDFSGPRFCVQAMVAGDAPKHCAVHQALRIYNQEHGREGTTTPDHPTESQAADQNVGGAEPGTEGLTTADSRPQRLTPAVDFAHSPEPQAPTPAATSTVFSLSSPSPKPKPKATPLQSVRDFFRQVQG